VFHSFYPPGTAYDALGQLEQMQLGNGLVTQYDYDPSNFRLTHIQLEGLLDLEYTYDPVGNVTVIDDVSRVETYTFAYDSLDRLLAADRPGYDQQTFAYTAVGNIQIKSGASYGYQDANHVHAVTHLGGEEKYQYDANGNMIERTSGSRTYQHQFDVENRLRLVTDTLSGTVTTVAYDGDGTRIWQSDGVTTTVYLDDLVEVSIGPGGRFTRTYYYAGGQRIGMRTFDGEYAQLYYLHGDHLGSTSLATYGQSQPSRWVIYLPLVGRDMTPGGGILSGGGWPPPLTPSGPAYAAPPNAPTPGMVVPGSETRYAPYGEVRTEGEAVAGLTEFTFTGQQVDNATGLMYYNARWYDPSLGRFIQADTIVPNPGDPQDLNRYSYVRNNPLRYIDPSGHVECSLLGAGEDMAGCRAYKDQINNPYGINFSGSWTFDQRAIVLQAAGIIERRLRQVDTSAAC